MPATDWTNLGSEKVLDKSLDKCLAFPFKNNIVQHKLAKTFNNIVESFREIFRVLFNERDHTEIYFKVKD